MALVPGVAFGDDRYARLSYAISMENIDKGIDRIEEAVKNLKYYRTTTEQGEGWVPRPVFQEDE